MDMLKFYGSIKKLEYKYCYFYDFSLIVSLYMEDLLYFRTGRLLWNILLDCYKWLVGFVIIRP